MAWNGIQAIPWKVELWQKLIFSRQITAGYCVNF